MGADQRTRWPRVLPLVALVLLAVRAVALDAVLPQPPPVLVGQEAVYAPRVEPGVECAWDFGDGSGRGGFAAAAPATHAFAEPGHYQVLVRLRRGDEDGSLSFVQTVHTAPTPRPPASSSTIVIDAGRSRVWVVDPDNDALTAIDATRLTRVLTVPTGRHPRAVALAGDGTVWVANQDDDRVTIHDADGRIVAAVALPYGAQPFGIVAAPDGAALFVTCFGNGRVLRLDAQRRTVVAEGEACPTPRGVAITHDGARLLVSRFRSAERDGELAVLDARTLARIGTVPLAFDEHEDTKENGRGVPNFLGAATIAPDGRQAVVPAVKHNTARGLQRDGVRLNSENAVRTMLASIDLGAVPAEDLDARLDLDNRNGAAAACYSRFGDLLFVALQGNDLVEVLDAYDLRRRGVIREVGAAPQGLALSPDGRTLFVHAFLGRSVTAYDVSGIVDQTSGVARPLGTVATVAEERLPPAVLRGKRLFYQAEDPRISFDGYISCAACHLDGGHDGRTWDFTDRGEGLRNTITLLGRRGTGHGPLHWSANFDEVQDFEHDIRNAFGGTGLMAEADFHAAGRDRSLGGPKAGISADLDALAAYVSSLDRYGRSPHRAADGTLTADGRAGRTVFARVGCADCHGGPDFTDSAQRLRHDVGTIGAASGTRLGGRPLLGIDTPTLRGLWETAPYLHDGSAATLRDVLTTRDPDGRHRGAIRLSDTELDQLCAYLQQIDDAEDAAPARPPLIAFAGGELALVAQPGETMRLAVTTAHPAAAIELLRDDRPVATAEGTTLTWTVPAEAVGELQLQARARFAGGASALSAPLAVLVVPQSGLAARYWRRGDEDRAPLAQRIDAQPDPALSASLPALAGAPLAAVWEGRLLPHPGPWALKAEVAGGDRLRVFVDGRLVIDADAASAARAIEALPVPDGGPAPELRIEYAGTGGVGAVRLLWSAVDRRWTPIPTDRLAPASLRPPSAPTTP